MEVVTKWTLFIVTLLLSKVMSQSDPCISSNHEELNDVTLLTSYTSGTPICTSIGPPGWYRFTGSADGLISDMCPAGNQCGTNKQIWMNDSVPSITDGIKPVKICVREGADCCRRANTIQVKNCSSFLVFQYISFPRCARICFVDRNTTTTTSTSSTTTTSTTSTTTTTTTTITTTPFSTTRKATTSVKTSSSKTASQTTRTRNTNTINNTIKTTPAVTTSKRPSTATTRNGTKTVVTNQSRKTNCNSTTTTTPHASKSDPCKTRTIAMIAGIAVVGVLDLIMSGFLVHLIKTRVCTSRDKDNNNSSVVSLDDGRPSYDVIRNTKFNSADVLSVNKDIHVEYDHGSYYNQVAI